MRLHTNLSYEQVEAALWRAQDRRRVAPGVNFADTRKQGALSYRNIGEYGSRTHNRAYEIQLGSKEGNNASLVPVSAKNAYGKVQKNRRTRQNPGDSLRFAATWHEWGWFMAEIFAADPDAMFGNRGTPGKPGWGYDGVVDFEEKTDYQFMASRATWRYGEPRTREATPTDRGDTGHYPDGTPRR